MLGQCIALFLQVRDAITLCSTALVQDLSQQGQVYGLHDLDFR